jgi:hypothetical protein
MTIMVGKFEVNSKLSCSHNLKQTEDRIYKVEYTVCSSCLLYSKSKI